ncbi:MAG: DUF6020 family protein [Butyrivibrio sp.]|nr:DUF6020 family protein [Butyrivibrio sp.]
MLFFVSLLESILASHALQLALKITVRNPLTVVFFAGFFLLCLHAGNPWKKSPVPALVASSALSIIIVYLIKIRVTSGFDSGLFKVASLLISFLGFSFGIYVIIKSIFSLKRGTFAKSVQMPELPGKYVKNENTVFFLTAILYFLICIPFFLYEFPGIMTADSIVQYEQIIGERPFSNHHPVIHTLLVGFFYNIGLFTTGDKNAAIAFYTVFQMIFMSICCGLCVREVIRVSSSKKRIYAVLSFLFYVLLAFNPVFTVTLWKDVIFAGVSALLFICLMEMKRNAKRTDFIWFSILALLFALLRSNAFYAIIVFCPFMLIIYKERIKECLISCLLVIAVVLLVKGPVFTAFSVEKPDTAESLSVPLQQIARVLVNDRELDENELALIDAAIDRTYIKELYAPDYADNIKELLRAGDQNAISSNKMAYFRLWADIGLKYPKDYIDAWYDLTGGYIYPDFSYAVGDVDGIMNNDYGLKWLPKIGGKAVVKGKEIFIKLGSFIPVYGMFFAAGAYTWALVISFIAALKNKRNVSVHILLILLTGTLLIASPVVDFRYVYALVFSFPLWMAISFRKE